MSKKQNKKHNKKNRGRKGQSKHNATTAKTTVQSPKTVQSAKEFNGFRFTPLDVAMFRDGRPFNQSDTGANAAESLFPPPQPTLVGAARFTLATQNGFLDGQNWPYDLLGNGVDWQSAETDLKQCRFGACRVLLHNGNDDDVLYPAPLHLVSALRKGLENSDDADKQLYLMAPKPISSLPENADLIVTDLENAHDGPLIFATAPADYEGVKQYEGDFVTQQAMVEILAGSTPQKSGIVKLFDDKAPAEDALAKNENRVGIGISHANRTVNDGELYTASFIRLSDEVSYFLPVSGIQLADETSLTRFGSEHRVADITPVQVIDRPPPVGLKTCLVNGETKVRYTAIALSPVALSDPPLPNRRVGDLPGILRSLVTGKPIRLGGWDSQSCKPLPMRQLLPSGTVFFMESEPFDPAEITYVGDATNWGFGELLIGNWPLWAAQE